MNSWLQVTEHPQLGCRSNLHLHRKASNFIFTRSRGSFKEDEPLQERGVHHGDLLLNHGQPEEHAAQAFAPELDALGRLVEDKREGLQSRAAGEHVVEALVGDGCDEHGELPEVREDVGAAREARGVRERPEAQEEALERGAAEDVGGQGLGGGGGVADIVGDDEILDALGGEKARPLGESALVAREPAAEEGDGAEGARVVGEDAGDGGAGEVGVADDERGGAPEMAPPGGKGGGAGGVLGGEAREDAPEEVVRENADTVLAIVARGGGEGGRPCDGVGSAGEPPHDLLHEGGGHGRNGVEWRWKLAATRDGEIPGFLMGQVRSG